MFPGFYICICRIACLCPRPYLSHGLLPAKHPPHRHGFQLPVRQVSEAGASELVVPSTKACHTHGSAGVGRGGCFAGTSPGISPGITLGISPFSRCRQFGTPENQKIRGGGTLWYSALPEEKASSRPRASTRTQMQPRKLQGPTSRGFSRNLWLPRQSMLSRTQVLPRQPMPSLPRASPRTQMQPEPW